MGPGPEPISIMPEHVGTKGKQDVIGTRQQVTGYRQQALCKKQQATGDRQQTKDKEGFHPISHMALSTLPLVETSSKMPKGACHVIISKSLSGWVKKPGAWLSRPRSVMNLTNTVENKSFSTRAVPKIGTLPCKPATTDGGAWLG